MLLQPGYALTGAALHYQTLNPGLRYDRHTTHHPILTWAALRHPSYALCGTDLDPEPQTLDPRPETLDPRPSTLDPRP
eukprot:3402556-Rhodomonas_salina.2